MRWLLDMWLAPVLSSQAVEVALSAVMVLTLLDVVFGVVYAIASKSFSSSKMREGLGHKSASLLMILLGLTVDVLVSANIPVGIESPVLLTICVYLCIMELGSLMETAAKLNPDLASSKIFSIIKGGE